MPQVDSRNSARIIALPGGVESTAPFDAFSPEVSATYKVIAPASNSGTALNLYGIYSQAFLPPRRPSQLTPTTETLDLKPEDISNYEGGLKALLVERASFTRGCILRHVDVVCPEVIRPDVGLTVPAG